MIKQLIKQIWTQRTINLWLWLELIIVFVCLSYVVDYLYVTATTYLLPQGYNYEHVYKVNLASVPEMSVEHDKSETDSIRLENLLAIMSRMRAYPGVEAVCVSRNSPPYSKMSSNGTRGIDTVWVHGWNFEVSPAFFQVFRVTDKNGEIEPLVEAAMQHETIIISEDAEQSFLQGGINPLQHGLKYWGGEEPSGVIRGISKSFKYDEFSTPYPAYYLCSSETETLKARKTGAMFAVRIHSQYDTPEFMHTFRNDMKTQLRIGNIFLEEIISYEDLRANYYRFNGKINDVRTYMAGGFFLLINIFLGVIGTFWIRTQQRRSEIALRIALGASRTNIRKYLLSEGFLLLILAAIPSGIIWANIVYMDLIKTIQLEFTIDRFAMGCLITFLIMAFMIAIGILFPARRAMNIQPAETLHEE